LSGYLVEAETLDERGKSNDPRPPQQQPPQPPRARSILTPVVIIAMLVGLFLIGQQALGPEEKEATVKELFEKVRLGGVEKVVIGEHTTVYTVRDGKRTQYQVTVPRADYWKPEKVDALTGGPNPPTVEFEEPSGFWTSMLVTFGVPLLLILFLWFLLFRQFRGGGAGGGVLQFGRSKARLATRDRTRVTFEDVAGVEEAKEEVKETIDFLKHPAKFRRMGARIPRGVLLVGQPGTGKTLLAKAVAGEAGVPFLSISGSDFVEMFVGVGASRVRDLFQQAKKNAPAIIFLDEIDAIGRKRGVGIPGGGQDERESTLNAILVEMDGFDTDEGIVVMAATNRPDMLDPALLRPGRFDKVVQVDMPDMKAREEILRVHARKVRMAQDVDLKVIAKTTPMFSGAELEALINEAALTAVAREKDSVDMECLEDARDKVRWGRQRKSRMMEDEEKKLTAYHEAGHAICSYHLPAVDKLHKVTIIPRGPAGGMTMLMPKKDVRLVNRQRVLAEITLGLGGRAAEEVFFDDMTSGASSDIQRATELARMMVCEWGMSERVGPVRYGITQRNVYLGADFVGRTEFSDETARIIDEEVQRIVSECYEKAKEIITEHREQTELIAEALMRFEVLDAEEVETLFREKSIEALARARGRKGEVGGSGQSGDSSQHTRHAQ